MSANAADRKDGEASAEELAAADSAAAAGSGAAGATPGSKEDDGESSRRPQERLKEASAGRIADTGKIGGPIELRQEPEFLRRREELFKELHERQQERIREEMPHERITITLPDGTQKEGVSFETTPLEIAEGISKSLAGRACVAKVTYTRRLADVNTLAGPVIAADDEGKEEREQLLNEEEAKKMEEKAARGLESQVWDLTRPLEGDCELELLSFDDPEGRETFWHSSAHILGQAMEREFGLHLCMGPATEQGFYYDGYIGDAALDQSHYEALNKWAQQVAKEKQPYQRVVLTKDEALDLFADNPFKQQIIRNKIPEGAATTAYRCGPLVDLCTGPHLPDTGRVKAFRVLRNSSAYWLGNAKNDSLQRIYAVSFPDKKQLKKHLHMLEEAKKRDHRLLGQQQDLFFFHELSPGSTFFLPHGARIYNKLMEFIRQQYWSRGYEEVVSPNIFNLDLWKISGHAEHYLDNMFTFDVEEHPYGLKPMNCPGHCLIFRHRPRTYRELPMRIADFGVLHRNEFSGALSGLTRVRRFQQDDAHIFCRMDQVREEVGGVLDFLDAVYGTFGFSFELDLSTRPEKAMGEKHVWDRAEAMMRDALNDFGRPWRINAGDGAFYGPKIDIKVYDAIGRRHQCATIQLDFQLPIRFNLKYKAQESEGVGEYGQPVIIHRAILGSVERMIAVLTEHTAGLWPFWLSPRQAIVVPVGQSFIPYAQEVRDVIHRAGFYCDTESSTKTLQKKVRESQLARYNFILVVGAEEQSGRTVNVRTRDNKVRGTVSLDDITRRFRWLEKHKPLDDVWDEADAEEKAKQREEDFADDGDAEEAAGGGGGGERSAPGDEPE